MSVQTHLTSKAGSAILSEKERSSISSSVDTLRNRLDLHFGDDISEQFVFGSSTRGTILPRNMDSQSDIDYMIVFADNTYKPQTYVSRLKRFAEKYYSSSDIVQSHPSVVLSLNHIKFDLVPAIEGFFYEFRIPAPQTSFLEWMGTSPRDFNTKLTSANTRCDSKLKPAIRLLKYWNARSGYVFDSFSLEQWAAGRYFFFCTSLRDYFFDLVENLSVEWNSAQWRKDRIEQAKSIVSRVNEYELNGKPALAEQEIKKLVP
ncbi:MAG: nucleotidyltransferase domain-containing protein [Bradyrhizobiaceae bacterium]|nr:nucleotidyltransferase domain-containing protein [Bradyrhizobiaceae bacterium]